MSQDDDEHDLSDAAFKLATLACLLAKSGRPTEADFDQAMWVWEDALEKILCTDANRAGITFQRPPNTILQRKYSFKEALSASTCGRDFINFGRITSVRGLIKKIHEVFLTKRERQEFEAVKFSAEDLAKWRADRPQGLGHDSEVLFRAELAGISDKKRKVLIDRSVHRFELHQRTPDEIIESGYLSKSEAVEVSSACKR